MNAEQVATAALRALQAAGRPSELLAALAEIPVRVTDAVPTAAIGPVPGGYRIALNPDFCARYVRDDSSALALIGHEVLHARRGHFGLTVPRNEGERRLLNIALDILVNATLMRGWPVGSCPLFREVNAWDEFPSCLLVPPSQMLPALASADPEARALPARHLLLARGWKRGERRIEEVFARHFARLGVARAGPVARLYLRGWLEVVEPAAYWMAFREILRPELLRRGDALARVMLLGDHGRTGADERLADLGAGPGDDVEAAVAAPCAAPEAVRRRFLQAVEKALEQGAPATTPGAAVSQERGVVPAVGRREALVLATGHMPSMWSPFQVGPGEVEAGVHLFADVSGSTAAFHGLYFALTASLGPRLVRPAWQWSTGVLALPDADIRAGRIRTTCGTDIACVIDHARRRGMRRLLVVTDGIFHVSARTARDAAGLKIVFLVTGMPFATLDVEELGAAVVYVPPEMLWDGGSS